MTDFATTPTKTLAEINRANAEFHGQAKDHEGGGAQEGQSEHRVSAAAFNAHTAGVKVTRNAGGHAIVAPQPYATGSKVPRFRAPKSSAFHEDAVLKRNLKASKVTKKEASLASFRAKEAYGAPSLTAPPKSGKKKPSKDLSHAGGKQLTKKGAQVVVQHDAGDALSKRNFKTGQVEFKYGRGAQSKVRNPSESQIRKANQNKLKAKDDSFPATDKTLRGVNDANEKFYRGNAHAGMAQDVKGDIPGKYHLHWSPTGQHIGTVSAKNPRHAISQTPHPYSKFKGEVYATHESEQKGPQK